MRINARLYICSLLFVGLFFLCDNSRANTPLTPPKIPLRVISLSPAITEVLFALEVGPSVVGVSEFSDFPDAAAKIPRVGDYTAPSIEKIVALKPDLVIFAQEGVDTITTEMQLARIPKLAVNMRTLGDYAPAVQTIAARFQKSPDALIKAFKDTISQLKSQQSHHRVLIQVEHNPLIAAGGDTFLSELVLKCGSANVVADLKGYPRLNVESLAKLRPSLIVLTAQMKNPKVAEDIRAFWREQKLTREPQVLVFDPDLLSRLGPRLPKNALSLCERLKAAK